MKIVNLDQRMVCLSDKINYMLEYMAKGELLCRWDDDDINLPWRLSMSVEKLGSASEWRPENHWYSEAAGKFRETQYPGNTHIMAIWNRAVLARLGGHYPRHTTKIGDEDWTFNHELAMAGVNQHGELLPLDKIFYIYRWGCSPTHLSAVGYEATGERRIIKGSFEIEPAWHSPWARLASRAAQRVAGGPVV